MTKNDPMICPPLTTADILTVRGKPALKRIEPVKSRRELQKNEEWVYFFIYNNTKEYYFFEKGRLVGWKKAPIQLKTGRVS
ncbi:MAG: hypothetical protein HY811_01720 [Planctomycetes bacterium]|nr:hypothetical protein [Planctomycetota bacterium]